MVISLQEQALSGVLHDDRWNLQNGGLDELPAFLCDPGVCPSDASRQKALLEMPQQLLHAIHSPPVSAPAAPPLAEDGKAFAEACSEAPYFISIVGKKRLRRLHRRDGCGTVPAELHHVELVEDLSGAIFDFSCRHCWRKEPAEGASSAAGQSSSSSESSSSSSSSGSAG